MSEFVDRLERELRAASRRRARLEAARLPRAQSSIVIAFASVLIFLAVMFAVLQARGPGSSGTNPAARPIYSQSVNARIVENFAQFRRPRTRADALPVNAVHAVPCTGPFSEGGPREAYIQGLETLYQIQCFAHGFASHGRVLRQVIGGLQQDQSRAVRLPDGFGTIWLIPSGHWLCNLLRSRSPITGQRGIFTTLTCEPVAEAIAHPPLWTGDYLTNYLLALEPDRVTKVKVGYKGGSEPTYLANNVLIACVGGGGGAWLEQTGPTLSRPIRTLLGGASIGTVTHYRPPPCRLP